MGLSLKMKLLKNFCTKRGSFGQFLIRIRIQDMHPDPNPGFESGFDLDPGWCFFDPWIKKLGIKFIPDPCWPDPDPK